MKLLTRQLHTNTVIEVPIPDDATAVRLTFTRTTAAAPTAWTDTEDKLKWRISQLINGQWFDLGESITIGGAMVDPQGAIIPTSWDETPLIDGQKRRLKVVVTALFNPVDTDAELEWL